MRVHRVTPIGGAQKRLNSDCDLYRFGAKLKTPRTQILDCLIDGETYDLAIAIVPSESGGIMNSTCGRALLASMDGN